MKFGVDYFAAASPSSLRDLKSHSAEFVIRYLATPGNVKNITRSEVASVKGAALDLVSVWEVNGDEPFSGENQGITDARLAVAEAEANGMPAGTPIYFALDRDPSALTKTEWAAVEGYYKGVASVVGVKRTGAYGGYDLIKRLFDKKLITYGYQTYAWSRGLWDTRAQLRQYLNAQVIGPLSVDFDHAVASDYGQWFDRPTEKPIKFYRMRYRNAKGQIQTRNTRSPILFQIRFKRVRTHGRVTQDPIR